ncbi:Serine--tRNA ligase, mitochondrial [Cryptotrichosporon argae]
MWLRPRLPASARRRQPRCPPLPFPSPSAPIRTASTSAASSTPTSTTPSSLPKPRLDYAALLANPAATTSNHVLRAAPVPPAHVAALASARASQLQLETSLNALRAEQRQAGAAVRGGTADALEAARRIKADVSRLEASASAAEQATLDLALALPNWSSPTSPVGPEANAAVVETFGPAPRPVDGARDHLRIAEALGWVDVAAGARAAGSSWAYLRSSLTVLEHALVAHALSIAVTHGYVPASPPDVVRADLAWRCGFQPRDATAGPQQTYYVDNGDAAPELCLAGTAEIPLAALFADQVVPAAQLPARVVGVGRAFRAEAGARGADTRGLYRVHQFTKVELFAVTDEVGSDGMLEEMRAVQREIALSLGLSVRVLDMPTEELGASAAKKYDMEAWMPGRGGWGEITSASNCTDYQARRLHVRYRARAREGEGSTSAATSQPKAKTKKTPLPFAHTLNGTAAAVPRLIVALLENGVRLGPAGEVEGVDLPKCLERWWIGTDEGVVRWV